MQLSTALGRPLAILDEDCSVELPLDNRQKPQMSTFVATIKLHQILKEILRTINSIKSLTNWQDDATRSKLKARVHDHHSKLVDWAKENASEQLNCSVSRPGTGTRPITASFFYISVILLYRLFMPHPHRASTSETENAQKICAQNAVQCIFMSDSSLHQIPAHYLIFKVQNIFVSAIVLLQCIRGCNDSDFIAYAFEAVEKATQLLKTAEIKCTGAKKYLAIIGEYIHLTRLMQQGVYRKGICNFSHNSSGRQSSTTTQLHRNKHSLYNSSASFPGSQHPQSSPKRRKVLSRQQNGSSQISAGNVSEVQRIVNGVPPIEVDVSWDTQRPLGQLRDHPPNAPPDASRKYSTLQSATSELELGDGGEGALPLFMDLPSLNGLFDSDLYWLDTSCGAGNLVDELDSSVFESWEGATFAQESTNVDLSDIP